MSYLVLSGLRLGGRFKQPIFLSVLLGVNGKIVDLAARTTDRSALPICDICMAVSVNKFLLILEIKRAFGKLCQKGLFGLTNGTIFAAVS